MRKRDLLMPLIMAGLFFAPAAGRAMPEADGFTPNQETPGQPVTYSVESNKDYAQKIERRLDDLYQEYQQFEFKINFLKDEATEKIKENLRAWNTERQRVLLMLEKLRFSTENAWETDKLKINSAVDDLEKTFAEIRSKAFSGL